ncbi:DUF3341 domain-containing protein [Aeoliella sp. ICT_H6.2]|uniref:DUF3341 domain-containing protein n=1 Tax=Aeoliella straminimaris TaxID=2954799 RepID=A0A9X2F6B6_9BACT|nr:quinol:electron acceptor oxidoreductase subunit ActD [Aeoliella straminimaris]MCO6043040.1 DUF3341 domain-containing protein [Aeoliella straminimaris]
MSDHQPKPEPTPYEPQVIGVLAEFSGPEELVAGARAIREKGYRRVEAFSPFPIHGIDEALAAPKPILPWVVLGAGLTGCAVAVLIQWYMNAYEAPIPFSGYDYNISGKPSWSLPANIPVTFELIILFSAFTAFLGMIAFNQLPKLSNPLLRNERFLRATDNKFFLLVEADDPQFATDSLTGAFQSIGAGHVEPVYDQPTKPLPGVFLLVGGVLAVAALVPLGLIAMSRDTTSTTPRLSIWWDMDYQPKYKAQTTIETSLFPDGRSMRLPVEGTVARGGLRDNPALYLGYIPKGEETFETSFRLQEEGAGDQPPESTEESTAEESSSEETPAEETTAESSDESTPEDTSTEDAEASTDDAAEDSTDESATDAAPAAETPAASQPDWVTEFPIPVNMDTMKRGQQRYNIYCSVCHGRAGDGDGLVHQRALELNQLTTWSPPTSIHQGEIPNYPVGRLYDTITNGNAAGFLENGGIKRGRMAGYKAQISVEDRWAIVLYVKALQKTRNASPDDLTEAELNSLKK